MEKYLKELITEKGVNVAYKECVHMIESLMHSCFTTSDEKIAKIKSLLKIIEEAEIESSIHRK